MADIDYPFDSIAARGPKPVEWCIPLTKAERDALVAEVRRLRAENADLTGVADAARAVVSWCRHNDDGSPWNLIMQMDEALDALGADRG